jgi:hypothetical protein
MLNWQNGIGTQLFNPTAQLWAVTVSVGMADVYGAKFGYFLE